MSSRHFVDRKKCPACFSDGFKTIYESPLNQPPISGYLVDFYSPQGGIELEYLEGAIYSLAECDSCGLIFQEEIPNDSLMERLYERWIDPQKALVQHQVSLNDYSSYAQEIMQIIAYCGRSPSTLSFFDFGMGWGKWALMAKAFGCSSTGSELSDCRIKYAQSNGIKVVSWDEIPRHQFDFINTEQVFEHIPRPLDTLLHLKKALKDDGLLKISVPSDRNIRRTLAIMDWGAAKHSRNSINPIAPLEHINFFPRKTIVNMARIAGMEEIFIPLRLQYQFMTNWRRLERIRENIVLPVCRNILRSHNHLLFQKVKSPGAGENRPESRVLADIGKED